VQCEEFENRLHRLLDRRKLPASDPALVAHAVYCAECQSLLDGYDLLFDGLDLGEPTFALSPLAQRVCADMNAARGLPSTAPAWQASWIPLALAASLLIAITALWQTTDRQDTAAPSSSNALSHNKLSSVAPLDSVALVPSEKGNLPWPDGPVELEQYGEFVGQTLERTRNSQWVEQVATGLRPLQDTMYVAWNVLRDNLSVPQAEATPQKPQAGLLATGVSSKTA